MKIAVSVTGFPPAQARIFISMVKTLLHQERPKQSWDVSIAAVSSVTMRRINFRYRRKQYCADVLSFLLQAPLRTTPGRGEILLCVSQIKKDAVRLRVPWRAHLSRMVIHACLHLVGYLHDTKQAWKNMEEKEKQYLE